MYLAQRPEKGTLGWDTETLATLKNLASLTKECDFQEMAEHYWPLFELTMRILKWVSVTFGLFLKITFLKNHELPKPHTFEEK